MPWISREEKSKQASYRMDSSMLETSKGVINNLTEKLKEKEKLEDEVADLLGYERKRKTRKTKRLVMYENGLPYTINPYLQNYPHYALGQSNVPLCKHDVEFDEVESKEEFIQRLISEHKEKQRLIKLAEEVEKGKKLKRESN